MQSDIVYYYNSSSIRHFCGLENGDSSARITRQSRNSTNDKILLLHNAFLMKLIQTAKNVCLFGKNELYFFIHTKLDIVQLRLFNESDKIASLVNISAENVLRQKYK